MLGLPLRVTDEGQREHFLSVFKTAQEFGYFDPHKQNIHHVTFGLVLNNYGKRFRTREGETVKLSDVLEEGLNSAFDRIAPERKAEMEEEELNKIAQAISVSCIKYADLCSRRDKDYVFDFDRMFDYKGNTAVYMLYAWIRVDKILKKADGKTVVTTDRELTADEIELCRALVQWYDKIEIVDTSQQPHHLCDWVYKLAKIFTNFYANEYVIDPKTEEVDSIRLELCTATKLVLSTCFKVLGLMPVENM